MVVWKLEWKKAVRGPKCAVFKWSTKSRDFIIWILDTHIDQYLDESDIQMVIVFVLANGKWWHSKFKITLKHIWVSKPNQQFKIVLFNFGNTAYQNWWKFCYC